MFARAGRVVAYTSTQKHLMFFKRPNIEKLVKSGDLIGLLAAVRHSDNKVAYEAEQALYRFKHDGVINAVTELLLSPEVELRRRAVRIFGQRSEVEAKGLLLAQFGRVDVQRDVNFSLLLWGYRTLLERLSWTTKDSGEALRTLPDDPGAQLKRSVIRRVQSARSESVQFLLTTIDDPVSFVRDAVVEVMSRVRFDELVDPLIARALKDPREGRLSALRALTYLAPKHALLSTVALHALGEDDLALCGALLATQAPEKELGPPLVARLRSHELTMRAVVLQALGALRDQQYAEVVASHLEAYEPTEKYAAISALARIGGDVALNALIDVLKFHDEVTIRASAAKALGQMGDPRAAPALEKALEDREEATISGWGEHFRESVSEEAEKALAQLRLRPVLQ